MSRLVRGGKQGGLHAEVRATAQFHASRRAWCHWSDNSFSSRTRRRPICLSDALPASAVFAIRDMQGTYTPWLVCLSITVAVVVSYTALSLASRVATNGGAGSRAWLIGGATAMGVGIWSMHFIGMLALSLPIHLTYSLTIT